VTPQDVADAIDLVAVRAMEFVGLADDGVEIQATGVAGASTIQRYLSDEFIPHPITLRLDELRAAFLGFLDGDIDGGLARPEQAAKPEKKRGVSGRG
jgi:hypothetical protein